MSKALIRQLIVAAVLTVALLAAPVARAQNVSVEFDQAVDFTKYKTFIVRDGQLSARSPALNSELTKKNIQTEIEKAFTAKGLTKVETGAADLNVFFQFGAAVRMETEAYPAGWRGLRTRVVRTPQNAGTMVIDLRDPTTRSLVWRSTATETEPNPQKMADALEIPFVKACQLVVCFEIGRRLFQKHQNRHAAVRSAKEVYHYVGDMRELQKEHLRGIYLNSQYRVIHDEVISIGSLTANVVHPREVFKPAIEHAAAALILVHNHPSGSIKPSDADIVITKQLVEIGNLLGIDVVDHVIVTKRSFCSIHVS